MSKYVLCGRLNRPYYGSCPSVRPSVLYELLTRKRLRTTEIGVNAGLGKSNRCADFQFKMSKVRVRVRVPQL